MTLTLYSYYRSSASYRIRTALHFKGLDYQYRSVAALRNNEVELSSYFRSINPQLMVPVLIDDSLVITQSTAIIEYLEEKFPKPALPPSDIDARAYVRSIAQIIACDIHPLNIMRVKKFLKTFNLGKTDEQRWYHHWLQLGFTAIEQILRQSRMAGKCCFKNETSIADIYLIPQVYNAFRFKFDMSPFPLINAINQYCLTLPYFQNAHPDAQPDIKEYDANSEY